MAVRTGKKSSAKAPKRASKETKKRSRAARKGWETRRARERQAAAQAAARARARAEKKARAAAEKARRSAAAKKGARKRLARQRAEAAFETWEQHSGQRDDRGAFIRETKRLHESWLQAKRELFVAVDEDYDDYLAILEQIAEASGTEWDIAYGPDGEAAA